MDSRDVVVIGIGMAVVLLLADLQLAVGIRFVMDREDCFSHQVQYVGDTVHVSFVVIKADSPWHYTEDGVDLTVSLSFPFLFFCCHLCLDSNSREKFLPPGEWKKVFFLVSDPSSLGNASFP